MLKEEEFRKIYPLSIKSVPYFSSFKEKKKELL